jgi:hypothetical protein
MKVGLAATRRPLPKGESVDRSDERRSFSLQQLTTIYPPRAVLTLALVAMLFVLALVLIGGFHFSDPMLPAFWVAMDYRAMEPQWQYLSGNAIFNIFGHTVTLANGGVQLSQQQFEVVGVAVAAFAYVAIFAASIARFGVERAAIFLGCVVLTTLDSTMLHWMGKADPLFICAYLIVFFGRSNVWITALGMALLVGVHREQAAVVSVIHVLVLILERRLTARLLLGLAGGFLVGAAAVQIYIQQLGLDEARDRFDYALREGGSVIAYSLKYVAKWFGLALPSVLLGGWWLALNAMKDRRSAFLLLLAIGVASGVAATTHDFTRGASLMVMPVTFYLAEYYARRWKPGEGLALKWATMFAFVALIGYEVQDNRIMPFSRPFVSMEIPDS